MAALLGVELVTRHEKYLGLPTIVGKNRQACFGLIKERLWKRLQSWKGKLLSVAGKESEGSSTSYSLLPHELFSLT